MSNIVEGITEIYKAGIVPREEEFTSLPPSRTHRFEIEAINEPRITIPSYQIPETGSPTFPSLSKKKHLVIHLDIGSISFLNPERKNKIQENFEYQRKKQPEYISEDVANLFKFLYNEEDNKHLILQAFIQSALAEVSYCKYGSCCKHTSSYSEHIKHKIDNLLEVLNKGKEGKENKEDKFSKQVQKKCIETFIDALRKEKHLKSWCLHEFQEEAESLLAILRNSKTPLEKIKTSFEQLIQKVEGERQNISIFSKAVFGGTMRRNRHLDATGLLVLQARALTILKTMGERIIVDSMINLIHKLKDGKIPYSIVLWSQNEDIHIELSKITNLSFREVGALFRNETLQIREKDHEYSDLKEIHELWKTGHFIVQGEHLDLEPLHSKTYEYPPPEDEISIFFNSSFPQDITFISTLLPKIQLPHKNDAMKTFKEKGVYVSVDPLETLFDRHFFEKKIATLLKRLKEKETL